MSVSFYTYRKKLSYSILGFSGGINGQLQQQQQGVRGLFTASQWMELEHQALIYKYITSNVPVPSYLLNPIRKAFESAGFPALRSNACKLFNIFYYCFIGLYFEHLYFEQWDGVVSSWASPTLTLSRADAGGPTARSGGAPGTRWRSRNTASAI